MWYTVIFDSGGAEERCSGPIDCQVEECMKTSQTRNPAEEDSKSGRNAQTGLLFAL